MKSKNIHPSAIVEDNVTLGEGVTIGPNAVIYSGTVIGNDVQIGATAVIGQKPTKAKSSTLKVSAELPSLSVGNGT